VAFTPEDEDALLSQSKDMLRRLRVQADLTKEERRVVCESMAEHAHEMTQYTAGAKHRAVNRGAESTKRIARKSR
jgi:hypothetical protein